MYFVTCLSNFYVIDILCFFSNDKENMEKRNLDRPICFYTNNQTSAIVCILLLLFLLVFSFFGQINFSAS